LTRLGVKPRPSPPVYEPELVADAVLYAAEHPAREIYVGGAGRALDWLNRLSPGLIDRLFSRFSYRPQMTNQPKTDQAPNNLYEHMEGSGQVKGSFGKEARSFSLYTDLKLHPKLLPALLIGLGGVGYVMVCRRKLSRRMITPKF